MKEIKQIFLGMFLPMLLVLASGCAAFRAEVFLDRPVVMAEVLQLPIDKNIYLRNNIWYTNADEISALPVVSGNYLPVGTIITPLASEHRNEIRFRSDDGREFRILVNESALMLTVEEYMLATFTLTEPEEFQKDISAETLKKITSGEVDYGMNRDEVIMAYGRPPISRTPSLNSMGWIYPGEGAKTLRVIFRGDKVVDIIEE